MSKRVVSIAILIAAFGCLAALSYVGTALEAGMEPAFARGGGAAVLLVVLFAAALAGNRFAWGVAFALSFITAGFALALALASPDIAIRWASACAYGIVVLAMWGLRPMDQPAGSEAPA